MSDPAAAAAAPPAYSWKRASNLDQLLHAKAQQQQHSPAKIAAPAASAASAAPPPPPRGLAPSMHPLQVSQTANRAPLPAAASSAGTAAVASVHQPWKPAVAAQPYAAPSAAAAPVVGSSPMRAAAGFMAGRTNATAPHHPPQTGAPRPASSAPQPPSHQQPVSVFQQGANFVPPWKQQMQAQQAAAAARAQQQQQQQSQPAPANIWARPAGASSAAPAAANASFPAQSQQRPAPPSAATGFMSAPRIAPVAPTSAGRQTGPQQSAPHQPMLPATAATAPFNRALAPSFAQQHPPSQSTTAAPSNPWARPPGVAAPFSHAASASAGAPAAAAGTASSSAAMFNSQTYHNGNRGAAGGAALSVAAAAPIWNRQSQPFGQQTQQRPQQPQQSLSQHPSVSQPATFASTGKFSWSGSADSFDPFSEQKSSNGPDSKSANAEFMARFRPNAAGGAAAAAGAPGSAPGSTAAAAGSSSALTPLCSGHNLPMVSFVSGKQASAGKKFFQCSVPKDKCKSWVWESTLHTPGRGGYKFAQRASDGQMMQEIVLSLEVVTEDRFSLSIVPPCVELIDKLMTDASAAEFGVTVDQQALASLPPYSKLHPTLFTFPLSKYDALIKMLRTPRPGSSSHWNVAPIPDQARKALLEDLALKEAEEAAATAAAKGGEPEAETEMAEQICENMAMSGPASSASSAPPAAAAAASSDDALDESNGSKKKKRKGVLLPSKKQHMDAQKKKEIGLTPAEEGCLNVDKLPGSIRHALLPFQLEGVRYIVSKHGRALLSDEMGLGKTIQGISVASYYHRDWPLLVICPSSLRLNWSDEIVKWMPFLNRDRICVIGTKKDGEKVLALDNRDAGVFIISYDMTTSLAAELKSRKFQCVIVDESHCIKSNKAKRTKTILPLLKAAKRVILLTGTPALNRPEELYTQIHALQPKLFPNYREFGLRYCDGVQSAFGGGMDFKGASHLKELHVLLKKYLLIRREKSDVLKQLPAKRRQAIYCEIKKGLCAAGLKEVKAESDSLDAAVRDGFSAKKPSSAMMKLWQLTGDAKLPQVQDFMNDLIETDVKFLVFAHHQSVLNALETFVRQHPKLPGYMRIDGSTPAEKRQENVHNFQVDDDCRIALLSITAAGTGLTLHAASHVLFAELIWTPAYLAQAEDRVHRIGQHRPVLIQYILGRNTLDDMMWPMISRKLDCIGRAVSGDALHLEMDETKEAPTDRDQRRLDSFLSPQEEVEDEALADVDDLLRAQQQEEEEQEEEDNLFLRPPPDSASSSARKKEKSKADKHRVKRRKTDSPVPPAASSSSAAAAAVSSLLDHSDDDSICDLTASALTPQTNRSLATASSASNGGSGRTTLAAPASAVRSPARAPTSALLDKVSPASPSSSARVAAAAPASATAAAAASPMAIDTVDLSAVPDAVPDASEDPSPHPSSGSRRRKRIAALSDDEEEDGAGVESDSGSSHLFPSLDDDDDDDFMPAKSDPLRNPKPKPQATLLQKRSAAAKPVPADKAGEAEAPSSADAEPAHAAAGAATHDPVPASTDDDVIPPSPEPDQQDESEWEMLNASAEPHKHEPSKSQPTPSASQQSHAKPTPPLQDDPDDDWLD